MDFSAAWDGFSVGDYIAVSDGAPEPSVQGGRLWFMWRSHNFVGRLVEKIDEPRAMRLELAPSGNATVAYTIPEAVPHSFAASDFAAFSAG